MNIIPTGAGLGATIEGLDLAMPMSDGGVDAITRALGQYGVIRFPRQQLSGSALRDFSARFGELEVHVSNVYQEPGIPEVMILSNVVENGKPIGLADAGQDWHTDMSYARMIAFANVLYGIRIPRRNGQALSNTEFMNMAAAYDDLAGDLKARLQHATALHDFNKFWEKMRREK